MAADLLNVEIDLKAFWHWWTQELRTLVPPRLLALLGLAQKPQLWLQLRDTEVLCIIHNPGDGESLLRFALDDDGRLQREAFFAEHPELAEHEAILCLDQGQGLLKPINLPKALEENLLQALGYEMNRYTPYAEHEVYYDAAVTGVDKAAQQLAVELLAVPKAELERQLLALRDWGLPIHKVGHVASQTQFKKLLPRELSPVLDTRPQQLRNALLGVSGCLLLLVLWLPLQLKNNYLEDLQQQAKQAETKAKEISAIKSEANDLLADTQKLTEQKRQSVPILLVLNELTRLLPKDTWLSSFQYGKQKIQIQGLSASASALIGILEKSTHFEHVAFISPVIPDRQSGQDRFQIAMDIATKPTASTETQP